MSVPWFCSLDNVYHTHRDCKDGQRARQLGAWPGTNNKPHCAECVRLAAHDPKHAHEVAGSARA